MKLNKSSDVDSNLHYIKNTDSCLCLGVFCLLMYFACSKSILYFVSVVVTTALHNSLKTSFVSLLQMF